MFEAILHALINAGIVLMLLWIVFYDSESTNPVRKHLLPKLERGFVWLGLNAEWRMFSPDPPMRTIWPLIRMTLRDGTVADWEPTPYKELSVLHKIRYKKFLKLYREVARPGASLLTKRNFVEYLLRRRLHAEPCVKVEIYMVYEPAPPFGRPATTPAKTGKQLVFTFHPTAPSPPAS